MLYMHACSVNVGKCPRYMCICSVYVDKCYLLCMWINVICVMYACVCSLYVSECYVYVLCMWVRIRYGLKSTLSRGCLLHNAKIIRT